MSTSSTTPRDAEHLRQTKCAEPLDSESGACVDVQPLRVQPACTQLLTLFLVELSNWRWSWTTMLLRGTVTPLLSLIALGVFARDSGKEAVLYVVTGNIVVGLLTPPLGVCLFVVAGVTGLNLTVIIRSVLPFLAVEFGVLLVVTYLPGVILFIPKLLGFL